MTKSWLSLLLLTVALATGASAQDARISVDGSTPGPRLSPLLYGIFFEEINHAGDGGLYPEKLRNRAFAEGGDGWSALAGGARSVNGKTLAVTGGVQTDGYWGIGVWQGKKLRFTAELTGGPATVALVAPGGAVLAKANLKPGAVNVTLTPSRTVEKASLELRGATFGLTRPSLLPLDTFGKSRVRQDLGALVEGLRPSFVRFPGGCFVEGDKLANRFDWKTSLGPAHERTPNQCLWGYKATNGLGYHEFLQWCEDMRSEPLFVVNCGMSHSDFVPMEKMDAVVQDALDAIEYANGDAKTTRWGAERARNGHPRPFGLKLIEIGNENGGPRYNERYPLIWKAIRAKHPEIQLIANDWGGVPSSAPVELIDEHYYNSPDFFLGQSTRYDSYPRTGAKIYVGEYAVTQGAGTGNLVAALGEAAFMTGMERNSDVVTMSSYAPLFVNANNRAWNPDAIVFDSLRAYGTPSYWVQRLFSTNRGDRVLKTSAAVTAAPARPKPGGGIGIGTWRTGAEYADVRIDGQPVALTPASGHWEKTAEGALRQTDRDEDRRAYGGDRAGTGDYTLTLRARKQVGDEGFLVLFRVRDEGDWYWWNLGGWGNTRHNIERSTGGSKSLVARDVQGRIEAGRWYDIKVECKGDTVKCYLDGVLIHDITLPPPPSPLAVVTTRDEKTGDILVKAVNLGEKPLATRLDLSGVGPLTGAGTATVLTGQPGDENSFANPEKVAPVTKPISGVGATFSYTLPAWSVTFLRLKTK